MKHVTVMLRFKVPDSVPDDDVHHVINSSITLLQDETVAFVMQDPSVATLITTDPPHTRQGEGVSVLDRSHGSRSHQADVGQPAEQR